MAHEGQDDDLALLPDLDETILLEKLKARYSRDTIYTYVGDIVVAVNPFKSMKIYGDETCNLYQNVQQRSRLPPHIYSTGDHMYRSMRTSSADQVCVISGESGAGKTESAKLLVKQVLHVSRSIHPELQAQILKVNPLLEALGNARTIMNNNSSRFGKFLKLHFNANAAVTGASIAHYLLEKSRVVTQNEGERNFHIFYLMFAGLTPEEKVKYELHEPSDYKYLFNPNIGSTKITNREQNQMKIFFKEVTDAMKVVGFDDEDYTNIFNLLAAILHLGQLNISSDRNGQAEFTNKDVLMLVSQLLSLEPAELAKALTIQVTVTRGETILKPNTVEQSSEFRNSLAKFLYGHLFAWVVKSLNLMLSPSVLSAAAAQLLHESDTFRGTDICILDIFGFENFKVNSFEQFCINVANEQLQYYFNQHIFRWEQEEYTKEGISAPGTFTFADNKPIIELFFAKPMGMFNLLDDETKFPRSSAKTLVDKFNEHCDKNPHYVKSKQQKEPSFSVKHYAGPVSYNCDSFLNKNRDALSDGVLSCIKTSKNDLIQAIVTDTDTEREKTNPQILLDCESPTQAMRKNRIVSNMLRGNRSRYRRSTRNGAPGSGLPSIVDKPTLSRKNSLAKKQSSTLLTVDARPHGLLLPGDGGGGPLERTKSKLKRATTVKRSIRQLRRRQSAIQALKASQLPAEDGIAWETESSDLEHRDEDVSQAQARDDGSSSGNSRASSQRRLVQRALTTVSSAGAQRFTNSLLRSRTMPHLKVASSAAEQLALVKERRPSLPDISSRRRGLRQSRKRSRVGVEWTVFMEDDGRAAIKASLRKRPARVIKKVSPTIGFYFKSSLASLMEKMLISVPHFIRCVKPNSLLVPDSFDDKLVTQQLRYTGVLETTRIRQLGYPTRLDFITFMERYRCLQPFSSLLQEDEDTINDSDTCAALLDSLGIKDYAVGNTKIFLRYHHNEILFNLVDRQEKSARALQKVVRGFLARRYFRQALINMFCQEVKEGTHSILSSQSKMVKIDESRHQERLEAEHRERERLEKVRLEQERLERERLQREKEEAERIERVQREKKRFQAMETERLQREKEEREFKEQQRLKRERDQQDKAQAEAQREQKAEEKRVAQAKAKAAEEAKRAARSGQTHERTMPAKQTHNPEAESTLVAMSASTGLHDQLKTLERDVAVVEFETEAARLAQQNILAETEYLLMEANAIRRTNSATSDSSGKSSSAKTKSKRPWCVLTVMEKDISTGSYSIYPRAITVDGTETMSPNLIGLNSNPPVSGHESVTKVRPYIGKGVDIEITADGSVVATRRSKNGVMVKGRSPTLGHCHSNANLSGDALPRDSPQEIFSASIFKQRVKDAMSRSKLDLTVLFCLCRVGLAFVRNNSNPHTTPCWVILDFVVPHLKVNEYLQRRGVKSERTSSPWNQADLFDPRMLCFTPPVQTAPITDYHTLHREDSVDSAYATSSRSSNTSYHTVAGGSSTSSDRSADNDSEYAQVPADRNYGRSGRNAPVLLSDSPTAVYATSSRSPASPRRGLSPAAGGTPGSTAYNGSAGTSPTLSAGGVSQQDVQGTTFVASKARIWAKRKVPGSKD